MLVLDLVNPEQELKYFNSKNARHRLFKFGLGPNRFRKGPPKELQKGGERPAEFRTKVYRPKPARHRLYKFGFGPGRFRKGPPKEL